VIALEWTNSLEGVAESLHTLLAIAKLHALLRTFAPSTDYRVVAYTYHQVRVLGLR